MFEALKLNVNALRITASHCRTHCRDLRVRGCLNSLPDAMQASAQVCAQLLVTCRQAARFLGNFDTGRDPLHALTYPQAGVQWEDAPTDGQLLLKQGLCRRSCGEAIGSAKIHGQHEVEQVAPDAVRLPGVHGLHTFVISFQTCIQAHGASPHPSIVETVKSVSHVPQQASRLHAGKSI